MLKAAADKQLVLGLIPKELEILKQGQPLIVSLADVGYPGAVVTIIVGDNHEALQNMMEEINRKIAARDSVPQIDLSQTNIKKTH